jgi:hypothetical protein
VIFDFPFSEGLLRAGAALLGLGAEHHVLEISTVRGDGSRLLARERGCRATVLGARVESLRDPAWDGLRDPLRPSRRDALDAGLGDRVEYRALPEGPWSLPFRSYDAALALGGTLTALGRIATLERLALHLVPRGGLLLADLVYLGAEAPPAVRALLDSITGVDGEELRPIEHGPAPVVRAILEQGRYTYLTEPAYRELLEALGFVVELTALVPESAWTRHFEEGARVLEDRARTLAAQEASAYYTYGGRGTVGYLFAVARLAHRSTEPE